MFVIVQEDEEEEEEEEGKLLNTWMLLVNKAVSKIMCQATRLGEKPS